jgi:hypothetical protein
MASTPEGQEAINEMTPEQRARFIPLWVDNTFHGLISLPPEFRMVSSVVTEATLAWIGAIKSPEYEGPQDLGSALWNTVSTDIFPDVVGTPIIRAFQGAVGKQFIGPNSFELVDPLKDTVDKTLDPNTAITWPQRLNLMGQAIAGASVAYFFGPLADTMAAMDYSDKHPEMAMTHKEIFFDTPINSIRYRTGDAKMNTVAGILMGSKNKASVANLTWQKLHDAKQSMDSILAIGNKLVPGGGNIFTPSRNTIQDPEALDVLPNMQNTEFANVWRMVKTGTSHSALKHWQDQYNDLRKSEDLLARTPMEPQDRQKIANNLTMQKQELNTTMLLMVRQMESNISQQIGRPFSFESYQVPKEP